MSNTEPPTKRPAKKRAKKASQPKARTAAKKRWTRKPGKHKKRFPGRDWPDTWPKGDDGAAARLKRKGHTAAKINKAAATFAEAGISPDLAAVDRMVEACGLPIDETATIAAWLTSEEYRAEHSTVDPELAR